MSIKIKATLFWARLNEVNEMSGKYQVDLAQLSPEAVQALAGIGIKATLKADDQYERGSYITCKSNSPIRALNPDGSPIPTDTLISNGSTAEVVVSAYDWEFKGKKGTSPSVSNLVVTKLIEYEAANVSDDGVAV